MASGIDILFQIHGGEMCKSARFEPKNNDFRTIENFNHSAEWKPSSYPGSPVLRCCEQKRKKTVGNLLKKIVENPRPVSQGQSANLPYDGHNPDFCVTWTYLCKYLYIYANIFYDIYEKLLQNI